MPRTLLSMKQPRTPSRGRPALNWLSWDALVLLPVDTAILVDRGDKHARTVGRIMSATDEQIFLLDRRLDMVELTPSNLRRARVIPGLFEPGDLCLLRGDTIRISVVAIEGTRVLVRYSDYTEGWLDESLIEYFQDS